MAEVEIGGERFRVEVEGREGAPWLLLSNSLGTTLAMWDPQMPALREHFRVLRYDSRGHGQSVVSPAVSIERLGRDALALLDCFGIARARFMGLSKGGMVGQWLLANAPERIERAVLANTSALMAPAALWNDRIRATRAQGMDGLVEGVIARWFRPGFAEREPGAVGAVVAMLRATPAEGYAASCAAIRDMDQREALRAIRAPVLVIVGAHDPATPPAAGQAIADAIPGARLATLEAAHLSNIEDPAGFTAAALPFLLGEGTARDEAARLAEGMGVRRAVLGDAWVDRATAGKTALTAEWQDFITRTAWGDVWTRPGLPRRERSIIVLCVATALGAWEELRLHVRGAIRNGLSPADIAEVLLQCGAYAGVPRANHAFKEAQAVLDDMRAGGELPP